MPYKDKKGAIRRYGQKHPTVSFRVTPAERERIDDAIAASGEGVKGYILRAIDQRMARERGSSDNDD